MEAVTPKSPIERDAYAFLKDRFNPESDAETNWPLHRSMFADLVAFCVGGAVGVVWDPNANDAKVEDESEQDPPYRVNYNSRSVVPRVQRTISRLVGSGATIRAVPKSGNPAALLQARVADRLLEAVANEADFANQREFALKWAAIVGTGFVKASVNPAAGPLVTTLDVTTGKQVTQKSPQIELSCPSPWEIRVPQRNNPDSLPWLIQTGWRSLSWVVERFPDIARKLKPRSSTMTEEGGMTAAVGNLLRTYPLAASYIGCAEEAQEQVVRVTELFTRPTMVYRDGAPILYQNGLHLLLIDSHIAVAEENPWGEAGIYIPFSVYRYEFLPGQLWGISLVSLIRPQQEAHDDACSRVFENVALNAHPKWVVAENSLVDEDAITGAPGEKVTFKPAMGPPPVQQPTQPVNASVLEAVRISGAHMDDASAQAEVDQGKADSSVRSGIQTQLLQEKSSATLGSVRREVHRADYQAALMLQRLAREVYDDGRILATVGPGKQVEVVEFRKEPLEGRIQLVIEGDQLDSPAARKAEVLELISLGVLDPKNPAHRQAIFTIVSVGDLREYGQQAAQDQLLALAENAAMSGEAPTAPPVEPWHDHAIHMDVHRADMNQSGFQSRDPAVQQIQREHWMAHMMALAEMQAQAQNGEESEPGKPSPSAKDDSNGGGRQTQGGQGGGSRKRSPGDTQG